MIISRIDRFIAANRFPGNEKISTELENHILNELACFDRIFWGAEDPDDLTRQYGLFREYTGGEPGLIHMMEMHLLASALVFRDGTNEMPDWAADWLEHRVNAPDLTGGPSFGTLWKGKWRAVIFPVKKTQVRGGLCRLLLTGLLAGNPGISTPPWLSGMAEETTLRAADDAIPAVFGKTLPGRVIWFPLIAPINGGNKTVLRGDSLGLSLALALRSLAEDIPLPEKIAATGSVKPDGSLRTAAHLDEKRAAVRIRQIRLFLRPAAGEPVPADTDNGVQELAVHTLDEAWTAARLYAPDRRDDLTRFLEMLRSADRFVRDAGTVPPDWIIDADRRGGLDGVLDEIRRTPELFVRMTDLFDRSVKACRNETSLALSGLFSGDRAVSPEIAPLSAFRWASLHVGMWNHRGDVKQSEIWGRRADELLAGAIPSDMNAVADAVNYRLVYRHNRYHFDPGLPEIFKKMQCALEKRYEAQCEFGCAVDLTLGAFYGTLGQNFAFCGPAYIHNALDAFQKTLTALGRDTTPENAIQWRRTYNYMAYVLLDAGTEFRSRAENCLMQSLNLSKISELTKAFPRLTHWDHALAARYLADARSRSAAEYLGLAADLPAGREHPWQLHQYNLGRISLFLNRPDDAVHFFHRSLERCRRPEAGPSIRIMALLPLSALHALGALDEPETAAPETELRNAAACLHPPHFQGLFASGFRDALDRVKENPGRWFPFNHR